MRDVVATVDEPLSGPQAVLVDHVCDRFESAWKSTGPEEPPPKIEEFLNGTRDPERGVLLQHLILLDVDYRRLRGEQPSSQDYGSRFPALSARFLDEALVSPVIPPSLEYGDTMPPAPASPQFRSERYVVRQFHARGGIGEVWLADDVE